MSDEAARLEALDACRSFLVRAPAGSGKTELLIQRYLTLLATVDVPEQIVAITFTRKAAAEMRSRILRALEAASRGEACEEPHRVTTLRLAAAVLRRDEQLSWALRLQPQRMRIGTLDALNAWLAQRLPVFSGGVAGAAVLADATPCYTEAARRCVANLGQPGELGEALRLLLRRLDNDVMRLERLLGDMLPRRDQWLRYVAAGNPRELRKRLEEGLERLVEETLAEAARQLPRGALSTLRPLLRHAAAHAGGRRSREELSAWLASDAPLEPVAARLPEWKGVAHLLLNDEGEWRRRLAGELGFGPAHRERRVELQRVLDSLRDDALLRASLGRVAKLPEARYGETQWKALEALQVALVRLAAELRVALADCGAADFVELALAAQRALGRAHEPSELLLALDRRIQHLLVDEFQDTSHTQLRLLELVTSGWQADDGRTLFLVGDPMQSIYRFRDADMSLFLKVKEEGIGQVRCDFLNLEKNFRSAPGVVDWINGVFSELFPAEDDASGGIARFDRCLPARASDPLSEVRVHALRGGKPRAEIDRVIEILDGERRRFPGQSLAILVQSRSHLLGLHEQLRARGWPVHAVEIDALDQQQVGQDLIGLARALVHRGDRVAWLGMLRAPWCGLSWRDLHALSAAAPDRAVWDLMHDPDRLAAMTPDGRERLTGIRGILGLAFERRCGSALGRWVERTWITLGGPACLDERAQLNVAETFFRTLEELGEDGDLDDPAALEGALSRARARPAAAHETGIEVMTIHRAKGLEFDCVVLMGLGREPRGGDARALYWMERLAAAGEEDFLLAPLASRWSSPDALTAYLKWIDQQRDAAERARLLYVAVTRARERLHLVAHLGAHRKKPPPRSLLACLWPHLAGAFRTLSHCAAPDRPAMSTDGFEPCLRRLERTFVVAGRETGTVAGETASRPPFEWAALSAARVGTVVHSQLHWLAAADAEARTPAAIRSRAWRFERELRLLGVEPEALSGGAQRVAAALCGVVEDRQGRWLLAPHPEAASELSLTLCSPEGIEHVRLDRTFVDEKGVRWIVDFKSSAHEGGALDAFLDSEVDRYRPQLERYAVAMAEIDSRPIRVGLYFPLLRAFRSWSPAASDGR